MRIIIAGAGIGGLTAALALHAAGHDVTIHEAVREIRPLGVGINLLPHAARILDGLGVLGALLAEGVETRELAYYNTHGQRIWSEPRGRLAGYDAPQVSIPRGVLQGVLLDAVVDRLGAGRVITGQRLTGFETLADRAVGLFQDGDGVPARIEADLLIAADGIHSRARAQQYPHEGPPVYSGRILWRAVSWAPPFLTGASMIMAGRRDQKFVCYPIGPVGPDGRQRINWIAELSVAQGLEREDWNRAGDPADFLPRFEGWTYDWLDVPELIRTAEAIYEFPMVDRDPLPRWTQGRVTLLGDAAHPMYPIGSNGASQAILDVEALARALAGVADPGQALLAYEAERLPATSAIVRANRADGPEQCMQIAHERAPEGFADVSEVFAPGELQAMADGYKRLTGLKRAPEAAA